MSTTKTIEVLERILVSQVEDDLKTLANEALAALRTAQEPEAELVACPQCGSRRASQTLNRMGVEGTLYPDPNVRYINWQCGHPLSLIKGCGYRWEERRENHPQPTAPEKVLTDEMLQDFVDAQYRTFGRNSPCVEQWRTGALFVRDNGYLAQATVKPKLKQELRNALQAFIKCMVERPFDMQLRVLAEDIVILAEQFDEAGPQPARPASPSPWAYESDGDKGFHTHYIYRRNDDLPNGVERIDFKSKREALKYIQEHGE